MIEEEIEILINHIESLRFKKLNEANTRKSLIEPLFLFLGWNTLNPDEVHSEFPVSNGKIVDYKLEKENFKLYVEAKPLGMKLNKTFSKQIRIYAYTDGIKYCILTDGAIYQLYETFSYDDSPIYELNLSNYFDPIFLLLIFFTRIL